MCKYLMQDTYYVVDLYPFTHSVGCSMALVQQLPDKGKATAQSVYHLQRTFKT